MNKTTFKLRLEGEELSSTQWDEGQGTLTERTLTEGARIALRPDVETVEGVEEFQAEILRVDGDKLRVRVLESFYHDDDEPPLFTEGEELTIPKLAAH